MSTYEPNTVTVNTGPMNNIGQRNFLNGNVTWNATDTLSFQASADVGYQTNVGASGSISKWNGWAAYARYAGPMPFLTAAAVRVEGYNDTDGFTTGTKQNLNEETLTLEKTVEGALLRLDIRNDSSDVSTSGAFYTDSNGKPIMTQFTTTFGAVFTF